MELERHGVLCPVRRGKKEARVCKGKLRKASGGTLLHLSTQILSESVLYSRFPKQLY